MIFLYYLFFWGGGGGGGGGLYESPCLFDCLSIHLDSAAPPQHVNRYTVAVYDLRMCSMEANLGPIYFKGDN